jgi:hypothetical protein
MMKDQKINRIKQVEMSSASIDRRLLDLAQLYKLGIEIQNARRLGKVNEIRSQESIENQDKQPLTGCW